MYTRENNFFGDVPFKVLDAGNTIPVPLPLGTLTQTSPNRFWIFLALT